MTKPITIELDRDALVHTAKRAMCVSNPKSPRNAERYIKCSASDTGELVIEAGGIEMYAKVTTGGVGAMENAEKASWLMDARAVSLTETMSDKDIEITITDKGFDLQGESTYYPFETMELEEWPTIEIEDPEITIETQLESVIPDLYKVLDYCDQETSRFALGGPLLQFNESTYNVTATDGRRLVHLHDELKEDAQAVIPAKAVKALNNLAKPYIEFKGDDSTDCKLAIGNRGVALYSPGFDFFCVPLEGRFPKYQDVIPSKDSLAHVFEIEVAEFLGHLKALAIYAPTKEDRIVTIDPGDGRMVLMNGQCRIETTMIVPDFESFTVSIRFLKESLQFSEDVTMGLINADSAVRFDSENVIVVLMPLDR